jgi:molybdopterin-synthase adenylyltransferase
VPLSPEWLARQALQLPVPGFRDAAERLAAARLRVVGAGLAAAPALAALVRAGFGKIWVEDGAPAGDAAPGWLGPAAEGATRAAAACAALGSASRLTRVERYPAGGVPTATLVCAASPPEAMAAAEQARRAGVPHVVLEPGGEGGAVVVVPPGAPCYACGRDPSLAWKAPLPGGAPLGCLAAVELLLVVLELGAVAGRRLELTAGVVRHRPTARRRACACARGVAP